jgi:hypothetical protein
VHFTRGDVSDRPKLWTLLHSGRLPSGGARSRIDPVPAITTTSTSAERSH